MAAQQRTRHEDGLLDKISELLKKVEAAERVMANLREHVEFHCQDGLECDWFK